MTQFLTPFDIDTFSSDNVCTLMEKNIIKLKNAICVKENWMSKIFDDNIIEKFRKESNVESKIFDYAIDELKYYVKNQKNTKITISPVDYVYESTSLIPNDLTWQLIQQSIDLEKYEYIDKHNNLKQQYDWHPGSNEQVLNLIHPSLYCYRIRKSILNTDGSPGLNLSDDYTTMENEWLDVIKNNEPEKTNKQDENKSKNKYAVPRVDTNLSKHYQWLPSDVSIDASGKCTFKSYINNLHPIKHKMLYKTLEDILSEFVPLFDHTLEDLLNYPRYIRANEQHNTDYSDNESDNDSNDSNGLYADLDNDGDDNSDEDGNDKYGGLYESTYYPQVRTFDSKYWESIIKNKFTLKDRNVQVIVKMANIVLTPEKPTYDGGAWHVEGMKNENIVASGIYYYDVENISDSKLEFREASYDPSYEQNDYNYVKHVYGLSDDDIINNYMGFVKTSAGKCITFPNILQHHVKPFQLTDKTKPGHRRILVFFLVNPFNKVVSTANVPPQQIHWYSEENRESASQHTISFDRAQTNRQDLMKERKTYMSNLSEEIYQRPFSLCEH